MTREAGGGWTSGFEGSSLRSRSLEVPSLGCVCAWVWNYRGVGDRQQWARGGWQALHCVERGGQERRTSRQKMFPFRRKDSTEPTEPLRVMWESVTPALTASGHLAFAVGPEGAVASSPPAWVLPSRGERSPEAFGLATACIPEGTGLWPRVSPAKSIAARWLPASLEEGRDAVNPGASLALTRVGFGEKDNAG